MSRLMGRLRQDFAPWAQRDLGELKIRYLFLDGWYPRVRIGKKPRAGAGVGHAGSLRQRPACGARSEAGRRRA
jgi:hypothetical protein